MCKKQLAFQIHSCLVKKIYMYDWLFLFLGKRPKGKIRWTVCSMAPSDRTLKQGEEGTFNMKNCCMYLVNTQGMNSWFGIGIIRKTDSSVLIMCTCVRVWLTQAFSHWNTHANTTQVGNTYNAHGKIYLCWVAREFRRTNKAERERVRKERVYTSSQMKGKTERRREKWLWMLFSYCAILLKFLLYFFPFLAFSFSVSPLLSFHS